MRFSDRIGVTTPTLALQVDSMSPELRNSLWNLFYEQYERAPGPYWGAVSRLVAREHLRVPVDELPSYPDEKANWVRAHFFGGQWYEVYNIVEFLCSIHGRLERISVGRSAPVSPWTQVHKTLNAVLEREASGYRLIDGHLVPITNDVELQAVNEALATELAQLAGSREHLRTALALFSKRPDPDYRNAVKEAILAVESVAKLLGTANGGGLAPALRALRDKASLHPALSAGFEKLYGYTSDEHGIRHAMLDEPNVGFDEAKYMIVACSAFVHYMASKAGAAGLIR